VAHCELASRRDPEYSEIENTKQTYYRWRKEFGGLKLDQAKRMKELERENAKLKRLVAELSLEKQILKDVTSILAGPALTTVAVS